MEKDPERDASSREKIEPGDATPGGEPGEAPEPPEPDPDHVVEEKREPESGSTASG